MTNRAADSINVSHYKQETYGNLKKQQFMQGILVPATYSNYINSLLWLVRKCNSDGYKNESKSKD